MWRTVLVVWFGWMLPAALSAQNPQNVFVKLLVNPPYTVATAPDAPPQGFIPELFRAFKVPGVNWVFQQEPWARLYSETLNDSIGNVILPTLSRSAEREPQFSWVAPVASPRYYFLGKASKTRPPSLEDLKSKTVAVLLGNLADKWLKSNGFTNLVELATLDQMVKMVESNRADFLVKDMTSLSFFLKSNNLPANSYSLVYEISELNIPLWIAGGPALSPVVSKAIRAEVARLKQSGELDRIWNKWQ